jgi:chromatin segregation and condensation protein Rec8/ScpA/Scc1 (kleisin family)
LALLELIRLKQLACVQPEHFSEIEISRVQTPETSPPAAEPANEPATNLSTEENPQPAGQS